jgi:hypothetical protein
MCTKYCRKGLKSTKGTGAGVLSSLFAKFSAVCCVGKFYNAGVVTHDREIGSRLENFSIRSELGFAN